MQSLKSTLAVFLLVVVAVHATEVSKCREGRARKLESTEVEIQNCKKDVCRLRRKTQVGIKMTVAPEKDIKELTTNVVAEIHGVPLPFVGVDGTSACDNMYTADGSTKVKCPLKAGEKYMYKNSFDILEFYPRISLLVKWALNNGQEDVTCFEVPAKIV